MEEPETSVSGTRVSNAIRVAVSTFPPIPPATEGNMWGPPLAMIVCGEQIGIEAQNTTRTGNKVIYQTLVLGQETIDYKHPRVLADCLESRVIPIDEVKIAIWDVRVQRVTRVVGVHLAARILLTLGFGLGATLLFFFDRLLHFPRQPIVVKGVKLHLHTTEISILQRNSGCNF